MKKLDLTKATLAQLYHLARYTEYRYDAILELDRRIPR
ncbi:hypothetical protein NIIg97_gp55 [Geobacillus phage vB_GthS_NIIg9.7]|nr:hypothetical protein NIIg97_gp55 [Geobacillus phage vB_GthS_NIIg9.7]